MKSTRKFLAAALAAAITGSGAAAPAPSLTIGSPAPALSVGTWVKGAPIKQFEKGKVYVVEFWATWCGPCKQSIPHLTELAKKYAGKATFTGVDVWESHGANFDPDGITRVKAFVKDYGHKMDYNVAADGPSQAMAKNWMAAAGQEGIPTAFVIDQKGTVAWIGHPMVGLDEAVGQIVAGTYDAKAQAAKMKAAQEARAREEAKTAPVMDPFRHEQWKETVAAVDKAVAEDPSSEMNYGIIKFISLARYDVPGANAYAQHLADGIYKKQPDALYGVIWQMLTDHTPYISTPDYNLAAKLAQSGLDSIAAGNVPEMKPWMMDTLAYAQFKAGQTSTAIATEGDALKATPMDDRIKKQINDHLALFQKGR